MAKEKVIQILNPAFKTGVSQKTGKQWTIAQVNTDLNHVTTVFAPVNIGDEIETTWSDQYGEWKAQKVDKKQNAVLDALRAVYELQKATYEAVTGEKYKSSAEPAQPVAQPAPPPAPAPQPVVVPEVSENPYTEHDPPEENYDNPIDLSDIPF